MQTQLDGVTVIDTEPWRGEPLLAYLRKMIFWAAVVAEPADLAVLSLLGPRVGDPAVLAAVGIDALPAVASASLTRFGSDRNRRTVIGMLRSTLSCCGT